MGENSKIEWCHHTFNPWWGCTRVSPGCERCYAETFSKRVGGSPWAKGNHWGVSGLRTVASEKMWREPLKWNAAAEKAGERRRVFVASMADVFEDRPELVEPRQRLAALIAATPYLDWLLLTKRPENANRLWADAAAGAQSRTAFPRRAWLPNIWLGTTAEDQRRADERIPHLIATPAAVRFVSYEPALERVDFSGERGGNDYLGDHYDHGEDGIDWLIVGGESGPGARPFDIAWARSAVEQCKAAGVAVFVKQLGANVRARNDEGWERISGDEGDGNTWPIDDPEAIEDNPNGFLEEYQGAPVRVRLRDRKGGDMSEWPADLRVREFPSVERGER